MNQCRKRRRPREHQRSVKRKRLLQDCLRGAQRQSGNSNPARGRLLEEIPAKATIWAEFIRIDHCYYGEGEEDKMFEAGNKALELNPDNVTVLALFAMHCLAVWKSTTPIAAQIFQKAEGYARHAIELMPSLPSPRGLTMPVSKRRRMECFRWLIAAWANRVPASKVRRRADRTYDRHTTGIGSGPCRLLPSSAARTFRPVTISDAIAAYGKCADRAPWSRNARLAQRLPRRCLLRS